MTSYTCISIGSNLGNRLNWLRFAASALAGLAQSGSLRLSRIYETDAVDCAEPLPYLNAAALFTTELDAATLLGRLHEIEAQVGRVRNRYHAPRNLDLDLLFHGEAILETPLVLPHPRLHLRRFVLQPLADIAANFRHPVLGVEVSSLLASLPPELAGQSVRLTDLHWNANVPSR